MADDREERDRRAREIGELFDDLERGPHRGSIRSLALVLGAGAAIGALLGGAVGLLLGGVEWMVQFGFWGALGGCLLSGINIAIQICISARR